MSLYGRFKVTARFSHGSNIAISAKRIPGMSLVEVMSTD